MRILICCIALFYLSSAIAQKSSVTLVIDPGHGGHDPGHLSADTTLMQEKELNLIIAKYLGGYVKKYLQNVNVVYTRTNDSYPSLDDRVKVANDNNADYFISIHCNGYENTAIRGTETHVHSMQLNKSVALARSIENQFSTRAGRHSRGVKDQNDLQHSLQVLKYTKMTSVLVECGYLTNHYEARYLNTTYGQEIIASAIFRAFREHITAQHPSIAFVRSSSGGGEHENNASDNANDYTIQILSSRQPIDPDDPKFKSLNKAVVRKELESSTSYKYIYVVGSYTSVDEARKDLAAIREKGYGDAFVRRL